MMLPPGHTDPAKLVTTGLIATDDVVTAAILFNCRFTLWTLFRVRMDPIVCFAFINK